MKQVINQVYQDENGDFFWKFSKGIYQKSQYSYKEIIQELYETMAYAAQQYLDTREALDRLHEENMGLRKAITETVLEIVQATKLIECVRSYADKEHWTRNDSDACDPYEDVLNVWNVDDPGYKTAQNCLKELGLG